MAFLSKFISSLFRGSQQPQVEGPPILDQMPRDVIGKIGSFLEDPRPLLLTNRAISHCKPEIEGQRRMQFIAAIDQLLVYAEGSCKTPEGAASLAKSKKEMQEAILSKNTAKINAILCKLLLQITDEQFTEAERLFSIPVGISLEHEKEVQNVFKASKIVRPLATTQTLKEFFPLIIEHQMMEAFCYAGQKRLGYYRDSFARLFNVIALFLVKQHRWEEAINILNIFCSWDDSEKFIFSAMSAINRDHLFRATAYPMSFMDKVIDWQSVALEDILSSIYSEMPHAKLPVDEMIRLGKLADSIIASSPANNRVLVQILVCIANRLAELKRYDEAEQVAKAVSPGMHQDYALTGIAWAQCQDLCEKQKFEEARRVAEEKFPLVSNYPQYIPSREEFLGRISKMELKFKIFQFFHETVPSVFNEIFRSYSNPAILVK